MVVLRDRALLLKRFPFSESSLVAHLCTREHGRVHVIAKGFFRTTSRYFAVLDLFDSLEIEWDHSPRRELSNLRAGSIAHRRRHISQDIDRYRAALAVLELADIASRPEHADAALFDIADAALARLNGPRADDGLAPAPPESLADRAPPQVSPDLVQVEFELRFLHNLGLAPSLVVCAACGRAAPAVDRAGERAAFSAGAGGRLCRACADEAWKAGRRVGTLPLSVLADAERLMAGEAGEVCTSGERIDRLRDFVERFLVYHLETQPRCHRAFLAQAQRNAATAGYDPR